MNSSCKAEEFFRSYVSPISLYIRYGHNGISMHPFPEVGIVAFRQSQDVDDQFVLLGGEVALVDAEMEGSEPLPQVLFAAEHVEKPTAGVPLGGFGKITASQGRHVILVFFHNDINLS